ncbi:helix-turn-helix transcriptional regulator [Flavobacterium sp.]|jgi:DNA-binding NarL/FixJ family response regulator|uniref:helix-turn-helix transcriptional regulator n=1 Tax=Flavobacterium sp. TaxID=239 RepID=UPI0037C156B8
MNVNVLIAIDNFINSVGIKAIISEGILTSNISQVPKELIIQKIQSKAIDILVIDYQKNNATDYALIKDIIKTDPRVKLFILTSEKVDSKIISFSSKNNIEIILNTYTHKTIIHLLNFSYLDYKSKTTLRLRKKAKNQNLINLLSERELEVALMLIKGNRLITIAQITNLRKSTISTYKRRIFEKTKVKNLIEMAELFSIHNNMA